MERVQVTPERLIPLPLVKAYFLLAIAGFVAWQLSLAWALPPLTQGHFLQGTVLFSVHLFTLAFATTTATGAMLQLLPVLAGASSPSPRRGLGMFSLYAAGLVLLLTGFWLELDPLLAVGGGLLLLAFTWLGVIQWRSLGEGTARSWLTNMVAAAPWVLVTMAVLGILLVASGYTQALGNAWHALFAWHLIMGAVGWFGLLITAISYQLLPFFGFQIDKKAPPHYRLSLGGQILFIVLSALAAAGLPRIVWLAAGLCGLLSAGVFLADTRSVFWPHKKYQVTPALGFIRTAHVCLAIIALAAMILTGMAALGDPVPVDWLVLLGFVIAAWITNSILGYLHQILPFMIWHNKYWERARQKDPEVPNPRVMTVQPVGWASLALFNAGFLVLVAGLLTGWFPAALGLAGTWVGTGLAAWEFLRMYRQ